MLGVIGPGFLNQFPTFLIARLITCLILGFGAELRRPHLSGIEL